MFAVLEFQDLTIIAAIVAVLTGLNYARSSPADGECLMLLSRLDRKVDVLIQHLDVDIPEALAKYGLSTTVAELADEGKKIEAIKVHRKETGVGLKEAKDAIEAYQDESS
ncbi:MAG: ribosomal protein L7/L12 [Fuerstiella sp.]|jgi:hypothetical protein|nr:ribosomal protein L7/L12 [Fuerstiella sp.]